MPREQRNRPPLRLSLSTPPRLPTRWPATTRSTTPSPRRCPTPREKTASWWSASSVPPTTTMPQGEDHPLDRPPVYRRALCGPYPRPVRHRADGHQPPRARLHHLCRGRSRPGPLHLCGQDFLCRLLPRGPAHSLYEREGGLLWSLTLFPVVGERQRAQGLAPGDTRPVHPFHGSPAPPHRL